MSSVHPARLIFCAEHDLPSICDAQSVTHVVSIGWPPPEDPTQGRIDASRTLVVPLPDDDLADLLGVVPEATTFIETALASASSSVVAVHCHAGESRSAAVVAAYLMRFEQLEIEQAMASVEARGGAPNEGFQAQLSLWAQMGCRVSTANEAYKLWSVAKVARERDERGYLESTSVMRDPGAADAVDDPEGGGWLACRKCRRRLARSTHVLCHEHGEGIDAFSWKARRKEGSHGINRDCAGARQCSSMFLTPLSWMKGIEDGDGGETRGKLCCPQCETKIGAFDWAGIQCSCGAWVSPAFQIQRAKTDAFGM